MDRNQLAADETRILEEGAELTTILDDENSEPPVAGTVAEPGRPSQDTLFALLSDSRRRLVLYALLEHDGRADISTLADSVATTEAGPGETVTTDAHSRAYTALYHTHLPKLADAGVIEYQRGDETVTLTTLATALEPYLELAAEDDLADATSVPL